MELNTIQSPNEHSVVAPDSSPFFLSPVALFCGGWALITLLYSLHLSRLLLFSTMDMFMVELPIMASFLVTYAMSQYVPTALQWSRHRKLLDLTLETVDRRLTFWFRLWVGISIIEIIYSRGIPILWIVTGSSKTYFDFGIPSIHGLMNSILLAVCITRFALALRFRRRKDYYYLPFNLFWATICITRQMIIVIVIEVAIIYCFQRKIKARRVIAGLLLFSLLIVFFGVIGDLRSGADAFRLLAQPSSAFPTWAPSGILWGYIYLTTPINNLINTTATVRPVDNWLLPSTSAFLLPTILRKIISGDTPADDAFTGNLVTEAFNVSTAFVGPFQDLGYTGMIIISSLYAFVTGVFWRKRTFRDQLIYAVFGQCLVLTIFFNHFFYLPIVFQFVWIYVVFRRKTSRPVIEFEAVL